TYMVALTATDAFGCSDTYSLPIEIVLEDDIVFVPNAFTPDNDGLNEVFRAYGPPVDDFRMEVYNRWGEVVFVSEDMNRGWTGDVMNSGYYGQNESYAWVITYSYDDERVRLTGHVIVLR
ncbi:MAG: gliding motility-associated C-terminal domain-containing protein, partial [Flavobacteriales bacterium]